MKKPAFSLTRERLFPLLKAFVDRATQLPLPDSLALYIGHDRCGWLFPAAAYALAGRPDVRLTEHSAHFGEHLAQGEPLNALLADLSLQLRDAGCTPGWRNELLDVWAHDDTQENIAPNRVAAIERGVMRPLGLMTKAVHLSGWSEDGRIWVARRALTKATDPGKWDTLVGGLVGHAEDPELALERESDEEAGLDAPDIFTRSKLRTIATMKRRLPEGFQIEAVLTCECVLAPHVIPSNRDGEVMDIQLLDTETIYTLLCDDAFTLEASIVIAEDLLRRAVN